MSLFQAEAQQQGTCWCKLSPDIPWRSSIRSFSQVSTHYQSWEARSFLQNWEILFLSFERWTRRTVHFYPITQYLRLSSGFWEVEESRRKGKATLALPSTCSFRGTVKNLHNWRHRWPYLTRQVVWMCSLLGDVVYKHLRFLMNSQHSLSGFLSPQEKKGNKRLPCSTGCCEYKSRKEKKCLHPVFRESSFCPTSIILTKSAWLLLHLRWAFFKVPKCVCKYILVENSAHTAL